MLGLQGRVTVPGLRLFMLIFLTCLFIIEAFTVHARDYMIRNKVAELFLLHFRK